MSAVVLRHPAALLRAIIVAEADKGDWVAWISHRDHGFTGTRTEFGPRRLVEDAARELSKRIGLPVQHMRTERLARGAA